MSAHFTIYTMPGCPHCVSAKQLLEREGKIFQEMTEFTKEELQALVGPVRTLPQIIMTTSEGKFHIGGYTDLVNLFNGIGTSVSKLD